MSLEEECADKWLGRATTLETAVLIGGAWGEALLTRTPIVPAWPPTANVTASRPRPRPAATTVALRAPRRRPSLEKRTITAWPARKGRTSPTTRRRSPTITADTGRRWESVSVSRMRAGAEGCAGAEPGDPGLGGESATGDELDGMGVELTASAEAPGSATIPRTTITPT